MTIFIVGNNGTVRILKRPEEIKINIRRDLYEAILSHVLYKTYNDVSYQISIATYCSLFIQVSKNVNIQCRSSNELIAFYKTIITI